MDFRKKVQPQPKPSVSVRQLVAEWGDDWALLAPIESKHWKTVLTDKTADFREAATMLLMERGLMDRINWRDRMGVL